MPVKMEGPVQKQMAVSLLNAADFEGDVRFNEKLSNTRRVFVQTENGCVLGIELDRNDTAHIVKRKMQLTLNIPVEKSSLNFGVMILGNDLSAIRTDSALLLTKNSLHRSSSTPCLSPTSKTLQQIDQSGGIVEIIGHSSHFTKTNELVEEIIKGLKTEIDPVPVNGGLGGAYYFRNQKGENVAIVKPTDEEPFAPNNPKGFTGKVLGQPGLKQSVRVGETGFREVAAYLLDHDHFARVPLTSLVKITHSIFNLNSVNGNKNMNSKGVSKIASVQQFIPHDFDASDHGTSRFPVADVHRIGILDVRIFNTDRHAGNLLVRKIGDGEFGTIELIPIDHGLCLPECLEDPYFEWIHWPQASIPFSENELEYIKNLNSNLESEMLRRELPMIREACIRVLTLCTVFLKKAATFGLCLAEIGQMMSREFRCKNQEPSELEVICFEAMHQVTGFSDEKDSNIGKPGMVSSRAFSYKESGLGKQGKGKRQVKVGPMGVRASAKELVGAPTSGFVRVGDMDDDEWGLFLEKFQELVGPAMAARKVSSVSLRNNPRLGRSCQF